MTKLLTERKTKRNRNGVTYITSKKKHKKDQGQSI